jgi:hypothetical protein
MANYGFSGGESSSSVPRESDSNQIATVYLIPYFEIKYKAS